MSTMSPVFSSLEERREQLAASAAAAVRRNRPRHLLVLAMVLLVSSCLMLLWSLSSRNGAKRDLDAVRAEAARVEQLVAEWKALKSEKPDAGESRLNEPLTAFYSRIEAAATRAGVKERIPSMQAQSDTRDVRTGAVQKKIRYQRVQDADIGALVRWLEFACEDVPGLQVYSLRVQPQTAQGQWQIDVTFSRWERGNR
ncbi:MAG: hypothetical protein GIKADHBN_02847 [Phycisphaerales bacterium]|nr:hypothetical protein [Phycisphaerales bacterium]MCK6476150.1 hypothetical protein [Phycisphaerales bacterium]